MRPQRHHKPLILSFRQKVESPGLSKRRFCAFDWPKRRSACLGLSSFWRNDHMRGRPSHVLPTRVVPRTRLGEHACVCAALVGDAASLVPLRFPPWCRHLCGPKRAEAALLRCGHLYLAPDAFPLHPFPPPLLPPSVLSTRGVPRRSTSPSDVPAHRPPTRRRTQRHV